MTGSSCTASTGPDPDQLERSKMEVGRGVGSPTSSRDNTGSNRSGRHLGGIIHSRYKININKYTKKINQKLK